VNDGWRLAPWADVLYACDFDWWAHNRGRMDFCGLKIGGDIRPRHAAWGVRPVRIDSRRDELLLDRYGTIGKGGNSGFQALNLAVQFGCRAIILVGFDMHDRVGLHWHGRHPSPLRNPTRSSLGRWRRVLDAQTGILRAAGVIVLNASPASALAAYPKMTLRAALRAIEDLPDVTGLPHAREEAPSRLAYG
jgi:hypothetical protein